jgi:hypothetical protein
MVGRAGQTIGRRGRGAAIFLRLPITIAAAVTSPGKAGADFAGFGGANHSAENAIAWRSVTAGAA